MNEQPFPLPENTYPFMKDIVFKLLDKNPETRPDALILLKIEKI
jgi:hypothetical protein